MVAVDRWKLSPSKFKLHVHVYIMVLEMKIVKMFSGCLLYFYHVILFAVGIGTVILGGISLGELVANEYN